MRATTLRSNTMVNSVMPTSRPNTNSVLAMVSQNGSLPKLVSGSCRRRAPA
jgi:hypothetical protein